MNRFLCVVFLLSGISQVVGEQEETLQITHEKNQEKKKNTELDRVTKSSHQQDSEDEENRRTQAILEHMSGMINNWIDIAQNHTSENVGKNIAGIATGIMNIIKESIKGKRFSDDDEESTDVYDTDTGLHEKLCKAISRSIIVRSKKNSSF